MGSQIDDGSGRESRKLPRGDRSPGRRKAALRAYARAFAKGVARLTEVTAFLRKVASRLQDDIEQGHIPLPGKGGGFHSPDHPKPPQVLRPVETLELKMRADRRVGVLVNGKRAFTLSPRLGAVLSILCGTASEASNVLVPWFSYAVISARLPRASAGDRPPSKHVVANYLYRLRAAFVDHGYDPEVLERAPHLGARLALRSVQKPAAPSAVPDPGTAPRA
jgi:hypothetical protein